MNNRTHLFYSNHQHLLKREKKFRNGDDGDTIMNLSNSPKNDLVNEMSISKNGMEIPLKSSKNGSDISSKLSTSKNGSEISSKLSTSKNGSEVSSKLSTSRNGSDISSKYSKNSNSKVESSRNSRISSEIPSRNSGNGNGISSRNSGNGNGSISINLGNGNGIMSRDSRYDTGISSRTFENDDEFLLRNLKRESEISSKLSSTKIGSDTSSKSIKYESDLRTISSLTSKSDENSLASSTTNRMTTPTQVTSNDDDTLGNNSTRSIHIDNSYELSSIHSNDESEKSLDTSPSNLEKKFQKIDVRSIQQTNSSMSSSKDIGGNRDDFNINLDPNPRVIRKENFDNILYNQEVAIRYLQPPTPPPGGPILIKEVQAPTPQLPPIIIRQKPPQAATPTPMIIRENPPQEPSEPETKIINHRLPTPPPKPRRVIIERLGKMPEKPRNVIVERWLPYKNQKRQIIYEKLEKKDRPSSPVKNMIIEWNTAKAQLVKQVHNLGVVRADPMKYRQYYLNELKDSGTVNRLLTEMGIDVKEEKLQAPQVILDDIRKSYVKDKNKVKEYMEKIKNIKDIYSTPPVQLRKRRLENGTYATRNMKDILKRYTIPGYQTFEIKCN
ncbi:hypothetical protein SNEBB_004721 [Seison nebaliae]|nr:hypothetical protein SNEBB_004721 [Seison nebaliae]